MYWLRSGTVRAAIDITPCLIVASVTGSGSSNSLSSSGLKYFQRSSGTDPCIERNYVWKCSGPLRMASLVDEAVDAIGNFNWEFQGIFGMAIAVTAQRSRKGN